MESGFDIPIALIVFNRPEETSQVFSTIAQIKPQKLFIIADGPRTGKKDESLISEVKQIVSKTSWPCEVVTDYSDINLGCNKRVSSGITRVFSQTDKVIVLEDDCVPDLSFFGFCRELLLRYENDDRIMNISGNNYARELTFESDYYFSRYAHCWGWATWRRAWNNFDENMDSWTELKRNGMLQEMFENTNAVRYWESLFEKTRKGEINSWAYRWIFSCWANKGLSINPKFNLVSNIGFGENATHTRKSNRELSSLQTAPLNLPLKHPGEVKRYEKADLLTERKIYSGGTLQDRALRKFRNLLRAD